MLSIIDEMLIGLVWKLEVGVKSVGWGLTRGLRGGRAGHFGVSIDRTNHITEQHKKGYMPSGPRGGSITACVCSCASTIHLPGLFWQSNTNTDRQLHFLLISFQHQ